MPTEQDLLHSLEALERGDLAKGGDALQNAPHDGGLATQGTNIQSKKDVKKALDTLIKGGMSKQDAEVLVKRLAKGFEPGGDDGSGEDDASGADDSSSMPPDGDDDTSSPMEKSIRAGAAQLQNASRKPKRGEGTLRKGLSDDANDAVDAAPILAQLVAGIEQLASKQPKLDTSDLRKSIDGIQTSQKQIAGALKGALSLIFDRITNLDTIVKSMADQPAPQRPNTLQKGNLSHPSFGDTSGSIEGLTNGGGYDANQSALRSVPMLDIQNELVEMCMKSTAGLTVDDVTKFENSHGNLNLLNPNVIKALEQRFCPAS